MYTYCSQRILTEYRKTKKGAGHHNKVITPDSSLLLLEKHSTGSVHQQWFFKIPLGGRTVSYIF